MQDILNLMSGVISLSQLLLHLGAGCFTYQRQLTTVLLKIFSDLFFTFSDYELLIEKESKIKIISIDLNVVLVELLISVGKSKNSPSL